MNETKFQKAVTNRANERVQAKVIKFKEAVSAALKVLDSKVSYHNSSEGVIVEKASQGYLTALILGDAYNKWPRGMWDREEALVTEEMFSMMNEVERAIMARPPKEDDVKPKEENV
jgi:hypothetical protein